MGNYEAGNEIFKFIGKVVYIKMRKGDLENVYIDEILKNKVTNKPSVIYFTTLAGKGEVGFVNFEDISYCLEQALEMEEVINVPELKGTF